MLLAVVFDVLGMQEAENILYYDGAYQKITKLFQINVLLFLWNMLFL